MSETQNQAQKQEELRKLVESMETLVEKLESLPSNKELERRIRKMYNIAKDIRVIADSEFDKTSDFDHFVLVIDGWSGIRVFAPNSKVEITYVDNLCLGEKSIYDCLRERFSDKAPMLNTLFEAFSQVLEGYMAELLYMLFPKENDP
jgi:hypothetical protein